MRQRRTRGRVRRRRDSCLGCSIDRSHDCPCARHGRGKDAQWSASTPDRGQSAKRADEAARELLSRSSVPRPKCPGVIAIWRPMKRLKSVVVRRPRSVATGSLANPDRGRRRPASCVRRSRASCRGARCGAFPGPAHATRVPTRPSIRPRRSGRPRAVPRSSATTVPIAPSRPARPGSAHRIARRHRPARRQGSAERVRLRRPTRQFDPRQPLPQERLLDVLVAGPAGPRIVRRRVALR